MLSRKKAPLKLVNNISPNLGCDPEFFFKQGGEVIGAEKVLPKGGLMSSNSVYSGSKLIIDGVQAELNPAPSTCRALLSNNIVVCLCTLEETLKKQDKGVTVDFSRTVEISKEKLMELEEDSRKFGCAPSSSIYRNATALKIAKVDPTEYRTRAAGGHIHFGKGPSNSELYRALTTDHKKTVAMLDLICGNTSVLIDRDKGNIERRKVYGRAGEFRLPAHGLEYRTLSNYWLTSYPLMSFAFGMARLAVQLIADPKEHDNYFKAFTSKVKPKKIKDAINNNDFDLAMENYLNIEPLLLEVTKQDYYNDRWPINTFTVEKFHYFVDRIKEQGLEYWFPNDPLTNWRARANNTMGGFGDFMRLQVTNDMAKNAKKEVKVA